MNMKSSYPWRLVIAAILIPLALCPSQGAIAAESVQLQVWTIRATRANQEISPQLKPLARTLNKTFNFTGYKLVKSVSPTVNLHQPFTTALAGAYETTITPSAKLEKKIKLKVQVVERTAKQSIKKLTTTVTLRERRFQLFGGWRLDGQDVLILAVSAK